jgi:hypothetical protein
MRASWWLQTLREWGWVHTGMSLLLGSLAVFNMGAVLSYHDFDVTQAWIYNVLQFGFPGVLALRVADRAVADGWHRIGTYAAATVAVIGSGVWVIGPLLLPLLGGEPGWGFQQDVMLACSRLLPFSIGTVAYAHWRQGSERLLLLQRNELARAREEQQLQSARLLALQARVEPQFLFDTLGRVRDGIGTSMAAAEARLTDLIALLRAMQPAVGATASTVARELALVRAYARTADAWALQPPRLQMQASAAAGPARLAPLLLLPALRALAGDAPAGPWVLQADTVADRLHITVRPARDDATMALALDRIELGPLRQRLQAVHGPDARVVVPTPQAPWLLFDLPLQHDAHPSPDR